MQKFASRVDPNAVASQSGNETESGQGREGEFLYYSLLDDQLFSRGIQVPIAHWSPLTIGEMSVGISISDRLCGVPGRDSDGP
jgi:hypothetical protein